MSTRRRFITRLAAGIASGGALLATRAAPIVERAVKESPRFIWDPERRVMTERVREGVYQVMTNLATR